MADGHAKIKVPDLETINKIVDLCIDRDLIPSLDQVIILTEPATEYLERLKAENGKSSFKEWNPNDFPVSELAIPTVLISPGRVVVGNRPPFTLYKQNERLLKRWSALFWAKRIRAEIQKNSRNEWFNRYDELILFLETNMPTPKDSTSDFPEDLDRTTFSFLMELSAMAVGEASCGYAERARKTLERIFAREEDASRKPYDRWIWLNMGLAYQHMGELNQKAVLEFNRVISEFWKDIPEDVEIAQTDEHALEFLLNICPATIQRSTIQLKLQLGYHALQSLAHRRMHRWLDRLQRDKAMLFREAANHISKRMELLKLEALLQLERTKEAKSLLTDSYVAILPGHIWNPEAISLPHYDHERNGIQIQLIEHTVAWFYESIKGVTHYSREIERLCTRITKRITKQETYRLEVKLSNLTSEMMQHASDLGQLSMTVKTQYLEWARENEFDERIYLFKWAQLLKLHVDFLEEITEVKKLFSIIRKEIREDIINTIHISLDSSAENLLRSCIELYLSQQARMPLKRSKRKGKTTIYLENLRGDDLPVFVQGLSAFYKQMSQILLTKEPNTQDRWKAIVRKVFAKEGHPYPIVFLKEKHFALLEALDEYEKEFGENQQISGLKRCNDRLIWLGDERVSQSGCSSCLNINLFDEAYFQGLNPKRFRGLLECQGVSASTNKPGESSLDHPDYEVIMNDTETHLTKHLLDRSLHSPSSKALHFLGLQRWNSLTPAQGRSVGGGYFIYRTDERGLVDLGIAIDPGFDFVRNLFRMGFSLRDIDIVLISHAHPDHLWDFESMVHLIHELDEKEKVTHRFNVILTLGSYQRLNHIITNQILRKYINPLVVDIRKEIDYSFFKKLGHHDITGSKEKLKEERINSCFAFSDYTPQKGKHDRSIPKDSTRWQPILPNIKHRAFPGVEIWPTRAYHDDHTDLSDSFGFVINLTLSPQAGENSFFRFGYTGDTKWVGNDLYNRGCPGQAILCRGHCQEDGVRWEDVASQYNQCDVVLIHLGSLIEHKKKKKFLHYSTPKDCEDLIRKANHPYLMGIIRFLRELYTQICRIHPKKERAILIGEFGEELRGGIRADLVQRVKEGITSSWPVLPVDVGLDILLCEDGPQKTVDGTTKYGRFKFLCAICENYHPLEKAQYFRFGQDECLFHICDTCNKATPDDVRHTQLRNLYEIGRPLQTQTTK